MGEGGGEEMCGVGRVARSVGCFARHWGETEGRLGICSGFAGECGVR